MEKVVVKKIMQKSHAQAAIISTPIGSMLAVADDQHIFYLQFVHDDSINQHIEKVQQQLNVVIAMVTSEILQKLHQELDLYFAGKLRRFSVSVLVAGTIFQHKVWSALKTIECGVVKSYQDIAQAVHHDRAVRAVGSANRINRCVVIIPCHRVIQKSGKLGGYAGGLDRKLWLLHHEQKMIENLGKDDI